MLASLTLADWIGTLGVAILLIAFLLNISDLMRLDGVWYSALNALGAGLAGYASLLIPFWPFVILEAVWCLASLYALSKALRHRKESGSP